jgi:uncharacterized RDD family membrane protein YckC
LAIRAETTVVDTRVVEPVGAPRDPTAVIGRRILAWLIDALIVAAIFVSLFAVGAVRYANEAGVADPCGALERAGVDTASCVYVNDDVYVASASEAARASVVGWGYVAVVFVVVQGLAGVTPGKLLTGLRVVDEQGGRPGLGRAAVRTVMWVVDGAPWVFPLVGFTTGLTTTGHRRVGDMTAKTYVVRRGDAGAPIVVPGSDPAAYTSPYGKPALGASGPPVAQDAIVLEPVAQQPQPVWDERWATWLVWDEPGSQWLRWDDARSTWVPMR